MKTFLWLILMVLACSALAGTPMRSRQWLHDAHVVGETYPSKAKTRELLGAPDRIEPLTVKDPSHYAPFQPLICAKPKPGTILQAWRYRVDRDAYWAYFLGDRMVCFTLEFDGSGSGP